MPQPSKKTLRKLDAFSLARELDRLVLPHYREVDCNPGYRAALAELDGEQAQGIGNGEAQNSMEGLFDVREDT